MELNDELFEEYKRHPRILEIRFILIFNIVEKEFGYAQTMKFFETICRTFNCNVTFINAIINRRFDIQRNSKKNYIRWRQEVIFAARCYGETIYKVCKDYINCSSATIYNQPDYYDMDRYITDEWLRKLDDEIELSGQPVYRTEITRFMDTINSMVNIFARIGENK